MRGKIFSFSLIHFLVRFSLQPHITSCGVAKHTNGRTFVPTTPAVGASHYTIVCLSFGCSPSVYGFSLTLSCQSLVIIETQQQPSPYFSLRTAFAAFYAFLPFYHNKQE